MTTSVVDVLLNRGSTKEGGGSRARGRVDIGFAIAALLLGVFPFAGLVGVVPLLVARRRSARVLGALAVALALGWIIVFLVPPRPIARSSAPRVYVIGAGDRERLDAEPLAGVIYGWAARRDVVRLGPLTNGAEVYELRIKNEGEGATIIDSVGLLLVDHRPDLDVLPTQKGKLVLAEDARPPLDAVDSEGRDVRASIEREDALVLEGPTVYEHGEPTQAWRVGFARPEGTAQEMDASPAGALLILRARSTPFAETTFFRYLAKMGQGMGPLMETVEREDCGTSCPEHLLGEELDRLAIPLVVVVEDGERSTQSTVLPIGPNVMQTIAVPIELPRASDRVVIKLVATPRFWDIDRIALARDRGAVGAGELAPAMAEVVSRDRPPHDAREAVVANDTHRVTLTSDVELDLRFPAPPSQPTSVKRSVFVALRGHQRVPVGGHVLVDPSAVLAHRLGITSLSRFAERL